MDLRTGRTYDTKEAALAAGVPASDLAHLTGEMTDKSAPEVRFASGPFKDRVYERRANGQLVRVKGGRGWIEKTDSAGRVVKVRA